MSRFENLSVTPKRSYAPCEHCGEETREDVMACWKCGLWKGVVYKKHHSPESLSASPEKISQSTDMSRFDTVFGTGKVILGMLHLGGGPDRVRAIAVEEARILAGEGFDGVIVENYFGSDKDVEDVVSDLAALDLGIRIGINVLGNDVAAFAIASSYPVDFIQIDSVSGHLPPDGDEIFSKTLGEMRWQSRAAVLGGVRFKYQPVRSGRSEALDVAIGSARCDGIVVTSEGTGIETSTEKTDRFAHAAPPGFPLIVGAGLTPLNVAAQMANARGGIVGSWLKEGHVDRGMMSPKNVKTFADAFRGCRS